MSLRPFALFCALFCVGLTEGRAQFALGGAGVESKAELLSTAPRVAPGMSFTVYLKLSHPEDWHSYYLNNAVPLNIIPTIAWEPIEGVSFSALHYPLPEAYQQYEVTSYVYHREVHLPVEVTISEGASLGDALVLKAEAEWQICKESCLSESASLELSLPTGARVSELPAQVSIDPAYPIPARMHDFEVKATLTDSALEMTLPEGAPEDLFFYDFDGITNLEAPQRREGRVLRIQRDRGNLFRDHPRPPSTSLRGIFASSTAALAGGGEKAVWVEVPLALMVKPQHPVTPEESTTAVTPPRSFDFPAEELAALYEPDTPIPYETLKKSVPTTFWVAVGGAFLGGILLNLMPCVFPVLGLKVMGFVEQAGEDPWKVRLHGLMFALGVIASMWVLAGTLLFLKYSAGQNVNWGQQMGDPRFVGGVIIVLFLFGLNMAGVFEIGTRLTSVGGNQSSKGYSGSFFSGIITTVVATPCSGPFLGAAMGYTLDQVVPVALLIFTVFALGIALPYLILSFFPALTAKMPRPGAWMETLKKLLSFAMFAAAAFFLRAFGSQTGWEGTCALILALVVLGLGAYTYGHWTLPHLSKRVRYGLGFGLSALILGSGLMLCWQASTAYRAPTSQTVKTGTQGTSVQWTPWQPGLVEKLRAEGYYVWVDYTAQWCATCLFNKARIFSDQEVLAALAALKVVLVKADMTDNSEVLAKDLSRVDRANIPVNLLYSPDLDAPAILLEELISPKDALKAVERIQ